MAYPTDQVATGDLITAAQINRWPVLLADTVLGGAAATIDFTSIPAHWTHLQLVVTARSDQAAAQLVSVRVNNDSGGNYDRQTVTGSAAVAAAAEALAATSFVLFDAPPTGAPAGAVGHADVMLLDYAATVLNKSIRANAGERHNTTSGTTVLRSSIGQWRSTAAINRVTVIIASGNMIAGSRASLYGMGRI